MKIRYLTQSLEGAPGAEGGLGGTQEVEVDLKTESDAKTWPQTRPPEIHCELSNGIHANSWRNDEGLAYLRLRTPYELPGYAEAELYLGFGLDRDHQSLVISEEGKGFRLRDQEKPEVDYLFEPTQNAEGKVAGWHVKKGDGVEDEGSNVRYLHYNHAVVFRNSRLFGETGESPKR